MASIQTLGPGPKPDLKIPHGAAKKKSSSGDDARRVDHIVEVAFHPVRWLRWRDLVGRLGEAGEAGYPSIQSLACALLGCWQLV
jgi:hypothetical protein